MSKNEILDDDKNLDGKRPNIIINKKWSSLILLEIAIFILIFFIDPFPLYDEDDAGLQVIGIIFSWIAVFKIWALYNLVFVLSPQIDHAEKDFLSFLLLELIVNSVFIYFDPFQIRLLFNQSDGGIILLIASIALATLVFYGWVCYKYFVYNKIGENFMPSKKILLLILAELILLVIAILSKDIYFVDMFFSVELFGTSILALFWLIKPPYIFKEK